ncbi:hypothetical protein BCR43DRAFT_444327, partial [Syncephalastrum racemosum]
FRAVHQSLSCRARLHRIIPSTFSSDECVRCPGEVDTLTHFLYSCSHKWHVWTTVWSDLFLFQPAEHDVHQAIIRLFQYPSTPSIMSSHLIISCIMQGLWSAHWRHIFDHAPFVPETIIIHIHFLCLRARTILYEPP